MNKKTFFKISATALILGISIALSVKYSPAVALAIKSGGVIASPAPLFAFAVFAIIALASAAAFIKFVVSATRNKSNPSVSAPASPSLIPHVTKELTNSVLQRQPVDNSVKGTETTQPETDDGVVVNDSAEQQITLESLNSLPYPSMSPLDTENQDQLPPAPPSEESKALDDDQHSELLLPPYPNPHSPFDSFYNHQPLPSPPSPLGSASVPPPPPPPTKDWKPKMPQQGLASTQKQEPKKKETTKNPDGSIAPSEGDILTAKSELNKTDTTKVHPSQKPKPQNEKLESLSKVLAMRKPVVEDSDSEDNDLSFDSNVGSFSIKTESNPQIAPTQSSAPPPAPPSSKGQSGNHQNAQRPSCDKPHVVKEKKEMVDKSALLAQIRKGKKLKKSTKNETKENNADNLFEEPLKKQCAKMIRDLSFSGEVEYSLHSYAWDDEEDEKIIHNSPVDNKIVDSMGYQAGIDKGKSVVTLLQQPVANQRVQLDEDYPGFAFTSDGLRLY